MFQILIVLLLMDWNQAGSAAVQHTRQWQRSEPPCRVLSPLNSPLVSAELERHVDVSAGCTSNATAPGTGAEVHVIRYHGNRETDVELHLYDVLDNDFKKPFIVVLVSNVVVKWQVRIRHQPSHLGHHRFVISKGSGFRFANKKMTSKPKITKPKHLPFESEDLLAWVEKRFSAVTSFSSLSDGNIITLNIGIASSPSLSPTSSTCDLHNNQTSSSEPLNVKVVTMATQNVEGCLLTHKHATFPKLAYVIELQHVQYQKPFEVTLEIERESRHSKDKKFWLVLKSPSQVTWRVHTKKVQGFINIVANSFVDMDNIRMHTVAVRAEELQESGMDLLRWVEYFLDPIALYVSMNNTNHIRVTLPHVETELATEAPPLPDESNELQHTQKQLKTTLTHALTTQCDTRSVTVAINKPLLQALGIGKQDISLQDDQCAVQENSTHVFIHSMLGECGTAITETQPGSKALLNMLVIHSSTAISEDALEGSALDDVFSGSGEREGTDLVLDDEELELRPLKIGFMCQIPAQPDSPMPPMPEPVFELHLFRDALFVSPVSSFPFSVAQPHTQLYLQALSTADPYLRSHIAHCWLEPTTSGEGSGRYTLVENGCAADGSVQFLLNGLPQSERLRFTFEHYVLQRPADAVDLQCQLTLCCISHDCGGYTYPLCPSRQGECQRHYSGSTGQVDIPTSVVTLGTLVLPPPSSYETVKPGDPDLQESETAGTGKAKSDPVVIEGLDSGTVVGIAFAAFIIGAIMMGALWFIHSHSGSLFSSGPFKRNSTTHEVAENEEAFVETTPGSSAPIST